MTDDIVVSGGGSSAVLTEEMAAILLQLGDCAQLLREVGHGIRILPGNGFGPYGVIPTASPYSDDLAAALREVQAAVDTSERLAGALALAAAGYGMAEQTVTAAAQAVGNSAGWLYGRLAGVWFLAAPAALLPLLSLAGGMALLPGGLPAVAQQLRSGLRRNPRVTSNPGLVEVVRLVSGSVDDALRGLAGVPWPVSTLFDDRASGIFGQQAVALALLSGVPGDGGSGPVQTRLSSTAPATAPRTLEALAARIPDASNGAPQVRIDTFASPEGRRHIVYLAGTEPSAGGTEPFDMAANLAAVAGTDSSAYQAARQAMASAGVTLDEPVLLVGYSQGGLVAARLAEARLYRVEGVVTLGAPPATARIPDEVPVLAVEHTEDVVPALTGLAAGSASRVLLRRSLYGDRPVPSGRQFPAHALASYQQTMSLADRSVERRLTALRDRLSRFPTGNAVASLWRSDRTASSAVVTEPAAGAAARSAN